jgi:hypothetical protein
MVAASISSPAGRGLGRGVGGEDLCRGWAGEGREWWRWPTVVAGDGMAGGEELHIFITFFSFFNWADKRAPVHVSTCRFFFASLVLTDGSHPSDSVSIHV